MQFVIGQVAKDKQLKIDLPKLIDTRMLVSANSGGGKSWLLRLIAERTAADVQIIILDPEGEFITLREEITIALIGNDGELATTIKTAKLLARKLAEKEISAIIDLYDLKLADRRTYVKLFLDSLMNLPRKYWHPILVILDEAHVYCPERSAGSAESSEAVIALMSQGRKRGYAGILSTQRLSKLHKDAAAEANNIIIGRTALDIDQKRAGDLLGMGKTKRMELRNLKPGMFYTFGAALSMAGVVEFRSDKVKSTHPKQGERFKMRVPPASKAILTLVSQMGDLPQEAQRETDLLVQLQTENTELKRDIAKARRKAKASEKIVATPNTVIKNIETKVPVRVPFVPEETYEALQELSTKLTIITKEFVNLPKTIDQIILGMKKQEASGKVVMEKMARASQVETSTLRPSMQPIANNTLPNFDGDKLPRAQNRILRTLAQHHPNTKNKKQIAILTSYSINSGGFANALSNLKISGFMEVDNLGKFIITDSGFEALGEEYAPLPVGQELIEYWKRKLGRAQRRILAVLCDEYPKSLSKEMIAIMTDYQVTSGGFNNALSKLRILELITGTKEIRASDVFYENAIGDI